MIIRIEICGFYGFGNVGDEAILQSIMDPLGDNEYIISTSLPYHQMQEYSERIGLEVRSHEDHRTDVDLYILGGGELNWGYAWRQCLSIFASNTPCMNYAVGYNKLWYYSEQLHKLYYEFLKNFNIISVRDKESFDLINGLGLDITPTLTFDPTINLQEEPFDCPENKILVFPRYEDVVSNQPQFDWLINELSEVSDEVVLVPCAPQNVEGYHVDLQLCTYLSERLEGSEILNISPFNPRQLKYLISKSKKVVSGGRYHPIVFAIAHDIPYCISPTSNLYPKVQSLVSMHNQFGKDGLKRLAEQNVELLHSLLN